MKGLFKCLLFTLLLFAVTSVMANVCREPVKTEKHPPGYYAVNVFAVNSLYVQPVVCIRIEPAAQPAEATVVLSETDHSGNAISKAGNKSKHNDSYSLCIIEDVIIPEAGALPDKEG